MSDRTPFAIRSLVRTTPADRGLVERPTIAPHLSWRAYPAEERAVLVNDAGGAVVLTGACFPDLLPLLDGTRTRHEIVESLEGRHAPLETQTALVRMATSGQLVSGEHGLAPNLATFWCRLGASPRWAERRLAETTVEVEDRFEGFRAALSRLGVTVVDSGGDLSVRFTDDVRDAAHAETCRRQAEAAQAWMLLSPDGGLPLFGPVFRPGRGPCWRCLERRMSERLVVETLLRREAGGPVATPVRPSPLRDAAIGAAALEIARWVVFDDESPLNEHAMSLNASSGRVDRHCVVPSGMCEACGDPESRRPDRAPVPVSPGPSPKAVQNSGGTRSVPPEETIRRHRHLVDPITGILSPLEPIEFPDDPWLHVFGTVQSLPATMQRFDRLFDPASLPVSTGKGSTLAQARASGMCEGFERYSGIRLGGEIVRRARFVDFPEADAIPPNCVELFSEAQLAGRADGAGKAFVPEPFDPEAETDWTPVWSFTAGKHRYLPTETLYYSRPTPGSRNRYVANSNGCASGNTLAEAILQGFFELVERDGFACWWFNRLRRPSLDLASFGEGFFDRVRRSYESFGREYWVLDVTTDLGIPSFVAVSRTVGEGDDRIVLGAGAHFDPLIAAMRAVSELNQGLTRLDRDVLSRRCLELSAEAKAWCRTVRADDHPYLLPDAAAERRARSDYEVPETSDHREDVELCRALVERKGMEFLTLDQTRDDVGLPVVRVIVPGLRHFWRRLAPGRLYEVPVRQGWLDAMPKESDLNPLDPFV